MITLHEAAAIRQAEHDHPDELASGVLMARAAHGVAASVIDLLTQARGGIVGARIVVLAGAGSNGGDALHAGAILARRGAFVVAIAATATPHAGGLSALLDAHGRCIPWDDAESAAQLAAADLVLDGLLGIGASGALREPIASIVHATHGLDALVVAVDLPTGVDADTGVVEGDAVDADLTVTFAGLKPGLVTMPGKARAGGVRIIDIGINDVLADCGGVLEEADIADLVPEPLMTDHKYRRGVVGICAGSPQYPGAALLSASAACAADIGMVEYLDRGDALASRVVDRHPTVVATTGDPSANTRVSAWVVGPGFSGTPADRDAIGVLLRCNVPVVLDAGALTAIAHDEQLRQAVRARTSPTVMTPHDGEFARLSDVPVGDGRIAAARALAADLRVTVVLKGAGTVIAAPDGTLRVDMLGSPALSTAGSGDVLAGLLGALLAGVQARAAASLDHPEVARVAAAACWIHGAAGRLAATGARPVTASDLAGALPSAIAHVRRPGGLPS